MRSRRVLTQNPSQELILPRSGCSPSMSVGQTPGLMEIGRSSMREAVRSCGQNYWKLSGKKSSTSGQRGQRQDFQNGLVSDQAKRKVIQKHQRAKMTVELLRRKKKRRKKAKMTVELLRRKKKRLLPKRR